MGGKARLITAFGRTLSQSEWATCTGISVSAIANRLAKGWSPEDAITTPAFATFAIRGGRNREKRVPDFSKLKPPKPPKPKAPRKPKPKKGRIRKVVCDVTGQRFGKLVVIQPVMLFTQGWKWECKCDCGNTCVARLSNLRSGMQKSCGCGHGRNNDRSGEICGDYVLLERLSNQDGIKRYKARCQKCGRTTILSYKKLSKEMRRRCKCRNDGLLRCKRCHFLFPRTHFSQQGRVCCHCKQAEVHVGTKNQKLLLNRICEQVGCMNPDCKWQGPFAAAQIDFHHIDPSTKSFQLSQSAKLKKKLPEIAAEVRKCTLLCANCHRLIHTKKLDSSKLKACAVSDGLIYLA